MANWKMSITTPWVEITTTNTPEGFERWPAMAIEYAADIVGWVDVTAQPLENLTPYPNTYVIEAVVPYQLVDLIKADPDYIVWWEEEITDGVT